MLRLVTEETTDKSPGSWKLRRRVRNVPKRPSDPRAVWDTHAKRWRLPRNHVFACNYPPQLSQADADLATLQRFYLGGGELSLFEEWTGRILNGETVAGILDKARGTIEADILDDDLRSLFAAQRDSRTVSEGEWRRRMATAPAKPTGRCDHDWEKVISHRESWWLCTLCGASSPAGDGRKDALAASRAAGPIHSSDIKVTNNTDAGLRLQ